jgi:hypothetical protein
MAGWVLAGKAQLRAAIMTARRIAVQS